jgi:ABC-2 type transport system permease protein
MLGGFSLQRTMSVARKEFFHIVRDPATLFFAFFIPILELFMLGYAIDTNVRNVRTVVLNLDRNADGSPRKSSERLLQRLETSSTFRIVTDLPIHNDRDLSEALMAGKARVGIKIPADYSELIERGGMSAQVLILIDGSESSIASAALSSAEAIIMQENLILAAKTGSNNPPIMSAPQTLYNPDTRSPNFFIPGLIVVMCQMMAIMLSANAIVREKENGTLEQLFMTPVHAGELIFGKLLPYLMLTIMEFCTILLFMVVVFQVPIHGPPMTLLALFLPFTFCFLGLGLMISTRVDTREAAGQMAMGTMMPSIFLSGYVFPLDSMNWFFYALAQVFPTTWMIDASRGVILRYASWPELWPHAVVLWSMGLAIFVGSMMMFRKRL